MKAVILAAGEEKMGDKKQTVFKHVPCDICGKDDFERLGRPKTSMKFASALDLKDVFIVSCKHCGFYYTQPMPFWWSMSHSL